MRTYPLVTHPFGHRRCAFFLTIKKPDTLRFSALLFPNLNYSKCFRYLLGQNRIHKLTNMTLLFKHATLPR
ncbi:hypothetical protein ALQ20_200091 [Pseudomonas syringae pv. atrofaciens]|nr:hypothetical protein ALQ20_200091 [Pseudomonas syringae pv. atrofaciens]